MIKRMQVLSLPMRWGAGDNYCYLVYDQKTNEGTLIDPASPLEVLPTVRKMEASGFKLKSIMNTHHHYDHSDGNAEFKMLYPELPVIAGEKSPLVTKTPKDKEANYLTPQIRFTAIKTPCHTQDSICWLFEDLESKDVSVFTGDTLFNCGCGRFFEGTAGEMEAAFSRLRELPKSTRVYPGHEYTKSNVKFALSVDPENKSLQRLHQFCLENEKTTGVFTIEDECAYNPFMRTGNVDLQRKLGTNGSVETMRKLRAMKDRF